MHQKEILRANEDAALFENVAASGQFAREGDPIYGRFGRDYFPHTIDSPVLDASFCLMENGQPILLVECNVSQNVLGFFGLPILLRAAKIEDIRRQDLARKAFNEFDRICEAVDVEHIRLMGQWPLEYVFPIENTALARGGEITVSIHATVSLDRPESELRKGVRKSYKSLINWGRKNLRLEYVNAENPDRNLFDLYRRFHQDVAGRVTRSLESWNVQFETIVAGKGELTLSYLDDKLISGLLVIDGETNSVYSSAVNDRDAFEKPMGHWPLFNALLRSQARGMRSFDIGYVPYRAETPEKESSIGKFKKGFTDVLEYRSVWEVPVDGTGK